MLKIAALVVFSPVLVSAIAQSTPEDDEQVDREHIVPCEIIWPDDIARDAFIAETWPDGIVPYEFNENVNATNRSRSITAMREIMSVSGVRFVPRTSELNRIIFYDSQFNRSFVGVRGGVQYVEMYNWEQRYVIIHELMHALGTWHEQQRPDRDEFVQINYENIQPGAEGNFDIRVAATPAGPYDFGSVMHYGQFFFTTNGMPTITVLPPNESQQSQIGRQNQISEGDVIGLVEQYGPSVLGDLTGENMVDETDLSILLASWGTPNLDLDDDGICGSSDLAILLASWTG